mgnify:CR=1 FL=1
MNVQDRVTEMRLVPADQLIANPANWRRHPQAQQRALAAVLDEVGFAGAVIAREDEDGGLVIIDGHARAEMVGEATVPVLVTDLTEAEADVVLATYDPIGAMAQKDHEAFATLAARIDTANETLLGLLDRTKDGDTDPDEVPDLSPEAAAKPVSVVGETYALGPHRVMCGDATVADDMQRLMGGKLAQLLVTDPPYAIYGSSSGLSADITDDKIVRPFFRDVLLAAQGATQLFSHIYVFCDWRSWASWWEMAKQTSLVPKNLLVWDKGGGGLGNNYANTYELIGYLANLPQQQVMGDVQAGQRSVHAGNILRANRASGADRQHNAAKPVDLLQQLIENSSDQADIVLDMFLGSGSTLIAAEQTGRTCYGMEIDPRYVDVIRQRYAEFVGDPSLAPDG